MKNQNDQAFEKEKKEAERKRIENRRKLDEDIANNKVVLKKGSMSYLKAVIRTVMTF